jgi:hypothetical protein
LASVVVAWPILSEATRAAIVTIVQVLGRVKKKASTP